MSASMLFSGLYVPGAGTLNGFCKSGLVPNVYLGESLIASRLFSGLYAPGAKAVKYASNFTIIRTKSKYQGRCWASECQASSQKSI